MSEESVAEMPKIISVRGGLSKKGIVRPIPPELEEKSLEDAVNYATRPSELKNDEERSIADSRHQEMKKTGKYILILNGVDSVTAEKIKQEVLNKYLKPTSRELENGERAEFGYAEIAVASVQEGGYKTLEHKL